jgi:ATP-dependent helicase YprA (DUF1998 family)
MKSNHSSLPLLAQLKAEQDELRKECSTLYEKQQIMEMQMEEYKQRLQWLDDKIVDINQYASKSLAMQDSTVAHISRRQLQSNDSLRNEDNSNGSISQKNNACYPWHVRMLHHLHNTFNIAQFRGHQEEIINMTMKGQDAFVIMRTGGGKSLTYQLPAVLELESRSRKVTIVISPLISLIHDQEEQMNQLYYGSAVSFTSKMVGGASERARRWGMVRDKKAGVALIFVTPETVSKSKQFKGELEKLQNQGRLGRFVIDEW